MKTHLKTYLVVLVATSLLVAACAQTAPAEAPPPQTSTPPAPSVESAAELVSAETNSALGGTRTYVIIPQESEASYIVDEEFFGDALAKYGIPIGTQDTVGSTQEIQGELTLDFDNLSEPLGENRFEVDLSTLTSDQSLRDRWLRNQGPRFGQYPTALFMANAVEPVPADYQLGETTEFQLLGELTIREITQPATFDITATLEGDTLTGTATADLRMTDFSIEPPDFANTLTVKDEFQIRIEFTARAQQ